jgi:hypothetical protein
MAADASVPAEMRELGRRSPPPFVFFRMGEAGRGAARDAWRYECGWFVPAEGVGGEAMRKALNI